MHTDFGILFRAPMLALALLVALGASSTAQAKPIVVNSVADAEADDGTCTLREAVQTAITGLQSGGTNGECRPARGKTTDIEFDVPVPATIVLINGELPEIPAASEINLLGPGPELLTVDANFTSRHIHVFGGVLTISGVTFANGDEALAQARGGGSVRITNSGTLNLSDCVFHRNTSGTQGGGAVFAAIASASISDCRFLDNEANGFGGAIRTQGANVEIFGSTFLGNKGFQGGAILNLGVGIPDPAGSVLAIADSVFGGNEASVFCGDFCDGGAIATRSDDVGALATTSVVASTIAANTADGEGGGVYNLARLGGVSETEIIDSFVVGIAAGAGLSGDIKNELLDGGAAAVLSLSNTIFDQCEGAGCP